MILYFGNMLSKHGFTPSTIETLTPKLQEKYSVVSASDKKNPYYRMLNMIGILLVNSRSAKLILIDIFSGWAFYYGLFLSILSRLFSVPYAPILHGGNLLARLENNPVLSRIIFGNSFVNISPSLFLQHRFKERGYSVKYIPNFIELEHYPFMKRVNCKPKLLWVRSFHKIYNPEMAIRVISRLSEKYPDAELCIVGPDKDGSMQNVINLAKELGVANQLNITGKLDKSEWIDLSMGYDIFLNTTNFDNHPVSVIEAMALGFPIVSTNAGGLKYLHAHKQDALLVEKNDVNSMVESIHAVLDDSTLAESLSINARKKAESFDWSEVSNEWFQLIEGMPC